MASLEASSPEALDFSELQAQTKTSVDVFRCLIGRGNLNRKYNLLFIKKKIGFIFCLECHLECQTLYVASDRTVNHFVPCPRLLVSERWIT